MRVNHRSFFLSWLYCQGRSGDVSHSCHGSWLSCLCGPATAISPWLCGPDCPATAVFSCLFYVFVILSWFSRHVYTVIDVLVSKSNCSVCLVLSVQSCLFFPIPVSSVLSVVSCLFHPSVPSWLFCPVANGLKFWSLVWRGVDLFCIDFFFISVW